MLTFSLPSLDAVLYVFKGCGYTIGLVLGAMGLGLALGLPMAAIQVYGPKWAKRLVGVYVWFFRGVPILVLLFLFYFGIFGVLEKTLSSIFGQAVVLPPLVASVAALGLASGAYQSQIFRGAILSLHRGQYLAAKSLGFTPIKAIFSVILPQALRLAIPAWANEYSILLKDSAVAYVLGTLEIMSRVGHMAATTHAHATFYILAGLLYFALTHLGITALKAVDKATRIPGLGRDRTEAVGH
ncbi:MAG: amino acid ABC transporter permease [Deltaproteobacteria bacterium]|jgi:polar amino acid transport system permease protein|nr:amino acid ABC transporter permease [Deltaproteobacteria bacterium]